MDGTGVTPPRTTGAPSSDVTPRLPLHPVLSWGSLRRGARSPLPSILDLRQVLHVSSGRLALALLLRELGIGPGDHVLIPAYHCTAMVEPVTWVGATPRFYRSSADLAPDPEDLAQKLDEVTRLVIVVHYFGFLQDLRAVRSLCDARGAVLVEDCAHAFYGRRGEHAVGTVGEYAIASSWKFFPVRDGGCLAARAAPLHRFPLRRPSMAHELRAAVNLLEEGRRFRRLRGLAPVLDPLIGLKDRLRDIVKSRSRRIGAEEQATGLPLGSPAFEASWVGVRATSASRLVLRRASGRRVTDLRRRNYSRLRDGLQKVPGCTPLFPDLPEGAVPYVFPLLMAELDHVFATLKARRVPILRFGEELWPGVRQVCAVAERYSRNLLQLPCHQEIGDADMDWMLNEIRAALT